jgi:AraC family transcriptional regulator, regulatory protein of adaptative response / methylphosphotriester-DNA alkyltransferase methyltransferase
VIILKNNENDAFELLIDISDEIWQAIILNDATYNDKFFYGVKTTGIFCRPSCKSRAPKKENVLIFQDTDQALSAQFRPCKRCKPTGERLPDDDWLELITSYIDQNFNDKLTLNTLAEIAHGSPYHLHRTFKRIVGKTPVEYIQDIRIKKAKELLIDFNKSISDIAFAVGILNTSYFITLFKKKTGQTPSDFRQLNMKEGSQ